MSRRRLGVVVAALTLACATATKSVKPTESVGIPLRFHTSTRLSATLYRPPGDGPFPAVVLMHDCPGVETMQLQVAKLLGDSGYVTLIVDSLSGRHVIDLCADFNKSPTVGERVEDAIAAKQYLSSLAFVDPNRIGLVGWAHSGITALMTWAGQSYAAAGFAPYAAVVAYYPYCQPANPDSAAPLLILIGEDDDWVPAEDCQRLVTAITTLGSDASIAIYPHATHRFDGDDNGTSNGHRYAHDAGALRDSHERLLAFFDRTLKK
jgi:dienelactone hydrolase